jgi:hypothetical protein
MKILLYYFRKKIKPLPNISSWLSDIGDSGEDECIRESEESITVFKV